MVFGLGKTRFQRAVEAYGLGRCSLGSGGGLLVGLGPNAEYRRTAIAAWPKAPKAVMLLEAPRQAELVAAFVASPEAKAVEQLMIGTSHDYTGRVVSDFDMREAVAALRGATMPALRTLSLGDQEMLFNGHRLCGTVGDITPVFEMAPNLSALDVMGHFEMSQSVRHDRLELWSVQVADTPISGGPPSQETMTHLFSSRFPALKTIDFDLEEGGEEADLALPDAFFTGDGFPALAQVAINRLLPDSAARLAALKARRGLD